MIDKQQIYARWIKMIETGQRHQHYETNLKVARFWSSMKNAADQDRYLNEERPGESKNQKKQRNKVTRSKTRYVFNKVNTTIKEVDRCDSIKTTIQFKGESEARKKILQDRIDRFYGHQNVDEYLDEIFNHYNQTDPNAFMQVDFYDFDATMEKPYSYPKIVTSEMTIDYNRIYGQLMYVAYHETIKTVVLENGDLIEKDANVFKLYFDDIQYRLTEILENQVDQVEGEVLTINHRKTKAYTGRVKEGEYEEIEIPSYGTGNKRYLVEEYEHKAGIVPFMQFGHVLNSENNNETYESLHIPAKEAYKELISKKSSYDVTLKLHGFAQKFAYVARCNYVDPETKQSCSGGKIGMTGVDCPQCKDHPGLMPIHRSEQDIITLNLPLPHNPTDDQVLDMSKMVHYVEIPSDIIQNLKDDYKDAERDVALAIFNTNIFNKAELVAATATEIKQNNKSVNNVLSDYARKKAEMYRFIVSLMAKYADIDEGLIVKREYPADFKLESVAELLIMRKSAIDAGSPEFIIRQIDLEILKKQNMDDADTVRRVEAIETLKPWNDKSEAERISSMTMLPDDDPKRIAYLYFDDIIDEMELENIKWYTEAPKDRKAIFSDKLIAYVERYKELKTAVTTNPIPFETETTEIQ